MSVRLRLSRCSCCKLCSSASSSMRLDARLEPWVERGTCSASSFCISARIAASASSQPSKYAEPSMMATGCHVAVLAWPLLRYLLLSFIVFPSGVETGTLSGWVIYESSAAHVFDSQLLSQTSSVVHVVPWCRCRCCRCSCCCGFVAHVTCLYSPRNLGGALTGRDLCGSGCA